MSTDELNISRERIAAEVHEQWMASKREQGVNSRQSETGEELMVPYEQLSEAAKDLDRGTVTAVLDALEAVGAEWVASRGGTLATEGYPRPLAAADPTTLAEGQRVRVTLTGTASVTPGNGLIVSQLGQDRGPGVLGATLDRVDDVVLLGPDTGTADHG